MNTLFAIDPSKRSSCQRLIKDRNTERTQGISKNGTLQTTLHTCISLKTEGLETKGEYCVTSKYACQSNVNHLCMSKSQENGGEKVVWFQRKG